MILINMNSIDLVHNKIESKLSKIGDLLNLVKPIIESNLKNKEQLDKLTQEFNKIIQEYDLHTLNTFTNKDVLNREEINNKYLTTIDRLHICKRLQNIVNKIKRILQNIKVSREIDKLITECQTEIHISIENKTDYKKCQICGAIRTIYPSISELICSNCGNTTILKGTVFEDPSTMDPTQQKRNDYDPTRHSDLWIDRILALRKVDFDPKALNIIKKCAKQDKRKNKESITCEYIRSIWKKYGFTQWNDDAPSARYLITGCAPPPLSIKARKLIRTEVIISMKIFDEIKGPDRSNALYYPYVVYKIISYHFKGRPEIKLLNSIHIQNDETLVYNDKKWEEICRIRNEREKRIVIEYEPTNVLESIF